MKTGKRTRVIMVTDGDEVARQVVEEAARQLGLRCISRSAGNPTPLTGEQLVDLIRIAEHDPVLVMVDDRGRAGKGKGERALEAIARHPEIELLGAIAVASNTAGVAGCQVDVSVAADGRLLPCRGVDKEGNPAGPGVVVGDTVDILDELSVPVVVGLGDIGKMDGADLLAKGAPLTVRAIRAILERSGRCGHRS